MNCRPKFIKKAVYISLYISFLTWGEGRGYSNVKTHGDMPQECFCVKIARNGCFFWKNPYAWVPIFGKITPEYGYGSQASSTNPNLRTLRFCPPFSPHSIDHSLFIQYLSSNSETASVPVELNTKVCRLLVASFE